MQHAVVAATLVQHGACVGCAAGWLVRLCIASSSVKGARQYGCTARWRACPCSECHFVGVLTCHLLDACCNAQSGAHDVADGFVCSCCILPEYLQQQPVCACKWPHRGVMLLAQQLLPVLRICAAAARCLPWSPCFLHSGRTCVHAMPSAATGSLHSGSDVASSSSVVG